MVIPSYCTELLGHYLITLMRILIFFLFSLSNPSFSSDLNYWEGYHLTYHYLDPIIQMILQTIDYCFSIHHLPIFSVFLDHFHFLTYVFISFALSLISSLAFLIIFFSFCPFWVFLFCEMKFYLPLEGFDLQPDQNPTPYFSS